RLATRRGRGVRDHTDPAVHGVDALPRVPPRADQGTAEGVRPLRDLPADRRHLYAVHADRTARRLGLVTFRNGLDAGRARRDLQAVLHRTLQAPVDDHLYRHGLAGADCDPADDRAADRLDAVLAVHRRAVLHAGHAVLPQREAALFARDLAPFRAGRQRLALHRGVEPGAA